MGGAAESPCVTRVHPQGFFRICLLESLEVFLLKIIQDLRLKILFLACLSEIRFLNLTLITTESFLQSKSMFFFSNINLKTLGILLAELDSENHVGRSASHGAGLDASGWIAIESFAVLSSFVNLCGHTD